MLNDFIAGFLGTLTAGGVLVALVIFFGEKFVTLQPEKALAEHQQGLNEKLAGVAADLLRVSDVLSRRNEREFASVERAWELMMVAVGAAQQHIEGGQIPAFKMMSEEGALTVIDRSPFTDAQKERLRSPNITEDHCCPN
ncbi:MAG: hypothetical protein AABO58_20895 [Acidobacteriota bacterium]